MSAFGSGRPRTVAILVAVSLAVIASVAAVLTVPGVSASAPGGNAVPPGATSLFGGVLDVPAASASHRVFMGNADFGFVSNVTQIAVNSSSFELILHEVYGISLSIGYCRPSCARPVETTTIGYNASETFTAWTNLTNDSSVVLESAAPLAAGATAAIGVLNSHVVSVVSVEESVVDRSANGMVVRSLDGSVRYTADSYVNFTTPGGLGLIPLHPSSGEAWISTSSYDSNASWNATWNFTQSGTEGGNITESRAVGSPFQIRVVAQPVLFRGSESGTAQFDAQDVNVISYGAITGNLAFPGGFAIALRAPESFFGDLGGGEWGIVNAVIGAARPTEAYTSVTDPFRHLVQSSTMSFATGIHDPYNGDTNDSLSNQTVAGSSMSPPTYNEYANCLSASAATCSATLVGPTPTGLSAALGPYVAVGVGVVVVALISAALVARRRQLPPPQFPNAALYPPGSSPVRGPPRPPAAPPPTNGTAPEPTGEADPLNQLW